MKKVLVVGAFALLASSAYAGTGIAGANNELTFSAGMHTLDYTETPPPGTGLPGKLDSETGTQGAVGLSASRQGALFGINDVYTSAAAVVAFGNTTYDGHMLDFAWTPYTGTTRNVAADIELRLGKSFRFGERSQFELTPYVKYAYHIWSRNVAGVYTEYYSHNAFGGGLMAQYAPTERLVLTLDANVSAMVGAQMKASPYPAVDMQGKPIAQAGLSVDYAVTDRLHVKGSYQYTGFKYGRSNTAAINAGSMYEPDSKTSENLVMVGISYSF